MKQTHIRFLLLLLFAGNTTTVSAQESSVLVWSDEFEYTGLPDDTKWSYDVGGHGWGNNELQYYTEARSENVRVENGVLTIEARKENFEGSGYTSTRLVSRNKGDWKYGRFEIRAKLPRGRGTWPAVWMLPTDWLYGGWPASGEIDIMEHVGYDMNRVHGTIHTAAFNHTKGTQVGKSILASNVDTEFHVYAMEWWPNRIEMYLDGEHYFTFPNNGSGFAAWPFDQRFHLLVANPPYIDAQDPHLDQGDVRFEPRSALVAPDAGLADLAHIVAAAPLHLEENGWLLLEHGFEQGAAVRQLLLDAGFDAVTTRCDLAGHERITGGCWRAG